MLAVGLTMWAATADLEESENRAAVNSSILGLLWLRILAYLKVVNESMATFVLSVFQILLDIRYFLLCMVVVTFMFADMFRVVYISSENIQCDADDIDNVTKDYCSNSINSYLRTYTILLGEVQVDQINNSTTLTVLWFLLTLFGVVIMLNVLIAVISESYEKSQESSASLFRSARAEFIAGHRALESFLWFKKDEEEVSVPELYAAAQEEEEKQGCCQRCTASCWRLTILSSLMFTSIWTLTFLSERIIRFEQGGEVVVVTAVAIVVCVVVGIGMWVIMLFSCSTFASNYLPDSAARDTIKFIADKLGNVLIRTIAGSLFGMSRRERKGDIHSIDVDHEGPEDKVLAHITGLEKRIDKTYSDGQFAMMEQSRMMEQRLFEFQHNVMEEVRQQMLTKPQS